jgi:single-strand DNA-binding protein
MNTGNIAILRGRITSEPRITELPSGSTLVRLEVTTRDADDTALSVPVGWLDPGRAHIPSCHDDVVVVGCVQRRFFRAGGVTQSRTEVRAHHVVLARRSRHAERVVAAAVAAISRAA